MTDVSSELVRLIDACLAANDESGNDAVRHAVTAGHKFSKSDLSDFRADKPATLVPAKILGLAAALQVRPYRVALAWLADHGISVPEDVRTPEDAIAHDHTLSARGRRDLLALVKLDRER